MKSLRLATLWLCALVVAGCASNGKFGKTPVMSPEQFLKAESDERDAYLAKITSESKELSLLEQTHLLAGIPVRQKIGDYEYTVTCTRGADRKLWYNMGHDAPSFDRNAATLLMVTHTDPNARQECQTLYGKDRWGNIVPQVAVQGLSFSQGFWRAVTERTVPAVMANTGAAYLNNKDRCKGDGCGNTWNIMGGVANAAANSNAEASPEVEVHVENGGGACRSDECGPGH